MGVCSNCGTRCCGASCTCFCHALHTVEDQPGDVHVTIRMRYFGVTADEVSKHTQQVLGSMFHPVGATEGVDNIDLTISAERMVFTTDLMGGPKRADS